MSAVIHRFRCSAFRLQDFTRSSGQSGQSLRSAQSRRRWMDRNPIHDRAFSSISPAPSSEEPSVRSPSFRVAELFPSIQGEGPFSGRPSLFVRLGNCNLRCAWCDTKYTWMFSEQVMDRMRRDIPAELHSQYLRSPDSNSSNSLPDDRADDDGDDSDGDDSDGDRGIKNATRKSETPSKPYVRQEELRRLSVSELLQEIQEQLNPNIRTVIFTGGEPLLHRRALTELIPELFWKDQEMMGRRESRTPVQTLNFEFETNGTLPPLDRRTFAGRDRSPDGNLAFPIHYNVSPKLSNSFQPETLRIKPKVLTQFAAINQASPVSQQGAIRDSSAFKFVIDRPEQDLQEIRAILNSADVPPDSVWLMPQGTTREQLQSNGPAVADLCMQNGFHYTHRVHVSLWGDKRGV